MVFCAYCGKEYTRKEHLERHLPKHTNVKPHRCIHCGLGYARRDLLLRHHTTYHEEKDPMDCTTGDAQSPENRNRIACKNCSQAKTGCDKLHPTCTRCKDKGLICEPRYARRSSKVKSVAAKRRASGSIPTPGQAQGPSATPTMMHSMVHPMAQAMARNMAPTMASQTPVATPTTLVPTVMNLAHNMPCHNPQWKTTGPLDDTYMHIDGRVKKSDSPDLDSPAHISPSYLQLNNTHLNIVNDMLMLGNESLNPEGDFMLWGSPQDYGEYPDPFAMTAQHSHFDTLSLPQFPDMYSMPKASECTPVSTPNLDSVSTVGSTTHTRSTSIASSIPVSPRAKPEILEPSDMLLADSAWPLARCNQVTYSGSCPRTTFLHLESLEKSLGHEDSWIIMAASLGINGIGGSASATSAPSVVPLTVETRDNLIVMAQNSLHKALDAHRDGYDDRSKVYMSQGQTTSHVLPSPSILDYFMQRYAQSFPVFYWPTPAGCIDLNRMMEHNTTSPLLALLMIAEGASVVPRLEARALSTGLIETCRLSLLDLLKNAQMCADTMVHQCALHITILGAWSGDKWLMDMAIGQRGMYLSMMQNTGMFERQPSIIPPYDNANDTLSAWQAWIDQETQNRLVYSWVIADHELSLFHDTAPMLSGGKLLTPLPGPDELWASESADQWMAARQAISNNHDVPSSTAAATPQRLRTNTATTAAAASVVTNDKSLWSLYQDFLNGANEDVMDMFFPGLTPYEMRLLLHPLQSLQYHLREMTIYSGEDSTDSTTASTTDATADISNTTTTSGAASPHGAVNGPARRKETQRLLQRWYVLSSEYLKTHPDCVATMANMVLYHLTSLNAVANFPAIERLARQEAQLGPRARYVPYTAEAVYHCGQVIRLVRMMPADRRPLWWSAAVYRAMLVLWADSVLRLGNGDLGSSGAFCSNSAPLFHQTGITAAQDPSARIVVIDRVDLDEQVLYEFLWNGGGHAVLSGVNDIFLGLDDPAAILQYAVALIEEGVASRFSDGIKRKLRKLRAEWSSFTWASSLL